VRPRNTDISAERTMNRPLQRICASVTLALLGGLMGSAATQAAPDGATQADEIFTNGQVYTPKGWAEAIAIKRGVMVAIGPAAEVNQYKGPGTRVFDLHGAAVLPGLHDMHVHPMGAGISHLACDFAQGSSLKTVLATVEACVKQHPKGAWITGGQWDATSVGGEPNRQMLDRVAPDNPIALTDISGHSLWANTKALELGGIKLESSQTNPSGGIIERDASGIPNGLLREGAAGLVRAVIPPPTLDEDAKALAWSLHLMLSYGITSFTDAALDESGLKTYARLADEGVLKQRVKGCIMWRAAISFGARAEDTSDIERRNLYARDRFHPVCIKIFLDGVPTDSHTAFMLDPYADASPEDPRAHGLMQIPPNVLTPAVIHFDAEGLTVKFHAAGDAAVHEGLDAIAAARKANGYDSLMHEVGHNSFVKMSDIKRARSIQATLEMSPYIWYPNPIIPDIKKAIGPERMKRWIPVKDAIDAGALVVPGSDWSVVPSVNPWIAIETLVTRQKPGGGGEVLGAVERITLKQAIDMFTVNSAREMGDRAEEGSLEPGLWADFVVLDRNPFGIPITQVHETKVRMAVINGEVVYQEPLRQASR
jgi:predicted amidohydrolase YtcJ